jgi:hypothetical protein
MFVSFQAQYIIVEFCRHQNKKLSFKILTILRVYQLDQLLHALDSCPDLRCPHAAIPDGAAHTVHGELHACGGHYQIE